MSMRTFLQIAVLAATTLALVATSPERGPPAVCSLDTGTFAIAGSCGWDGGVTIHTQEGDVTNCMLELTGAIASFATGTPDSGRLQFEDTSTVSDAGTRLCTALEFPDGGYEVICDRCPSNSGNCRPDCAATFTP